MHVFTSLLSQTTTLAMLAVCGLALILGRWPERAAAVALALAWISSALGQDRRPAHHSQPIEMALDFVLAVFLLGLTVSCRRTWLLWMSACAVLLVFTHVMVLLDSSLGQWSYLTAYYVWSIGVLLSLGLGVLVEGRKPAPLLIRFTPGGG